MDIAAYFIDPSLISVRTPVWPRPHYAKEFENGGCTLKTHQMFSVHTTPKEFKNATITGHFGFVFEKNSVSEITLSARRYDFRKAPFTKYLFSVHTKMKSQRFQIPPV